ncbi:carboxypeptidase M32 [Novipirellula artificiosorum]|uniref:Metal-dependent carboxypeptidase n=1 Tax=Novipirellula artificiosorum TaxID=2528016 RepID=A0A5C6D7F5_9BACT|nr:carboxypeptidase M32 [Novipirellula artificiosorum]TWU32862.1 Thermostable carboxypeptidase 1 [Novipirellula artificiosorum]
MTLDQKKWNTVCDKAREAMLLQTVADTLEWDERTGMPRGGGDYRADQVSYLRAMVHRIRTEPAHGEMLQQLSEQVGELDPQDDLAATVRGLRRNFMRDHRLPEALVERIARATVKGQQCWDAARRADDFSLFRDSLSEVVELKREVGQRIAEGSEKSPYETLLDEYEPDARVESLQTMFNDLRGPLVQLIEQIREAPQQPDRSLLQRDYSVAAQREFSRFVASAIGFDFDRGRLDETSHPFCTTLGPSDCRILTRYDARWLPSGLLGTMHEAGHGMYEQGLRREWFGLPPGSYCSLGIHESQSRLWENQVGRSRSFWSWAFDHAKKAFAPTLDNVTANGLHFAINQVQPSLIRVEADEATYNLHIIIRFDLEQRLIDGTLLVDDLPDAWNLAYERDLGIRPPSDANGVLQDVHWSAGLIGYFPTYTIGNLASAQLFDAAAAELGDLDLAFARGDFLPLQQWLREKIHRRGQCESGESLVQNATGRPLSADSLVAYLRNKLGNLYRFEMP